MSRSFASIGAFVAFMESRLASLPAAERAGMEKGSAILLEEARSLPGTYAAGWPRLDPDTVKAKATGDSPLRETGALAGSYKRKVTSSRHAAVGSNDPKAVWHEHGTSRGIPPRPVLQAAGARKGAEAARAVGATIIAHLGGRTSR